ncbi:putative DNA-directed RNA polymerase II subunit RPB2, partial [Aureobasidium melanogenum]
MADVWGNGVGSPSQDDYDEDDIITSEDCWTVIQSFFDSKGLVSQQLDSFDEFAGTSMQDIVTEQGRIVIDQNAPQDDNEVDPIVKRRYEIEFGNITISQAAITEGDGSTRPLYPNEARLRNLTYSSPIYLGMTSRVLVARERRIGAAHHDDEDPDHATNEDEETELVWEKEDPDAIEKEERVFIGKLPVMIKSKICTLRNRSEQELYAFQECPYDQGGYFIINGSEKVLIAQERSAANIVQVFRKKGSPTPIVAEIRSAIEKGTRLLSSMQLKWYQKGDQSKTGSVGGVIKATLPYIKADIPIAIVFRALGIVSDMQILDCICYDANDTQLREMIKPCLEEAFVVQDREFALDFIGRRGQQSGTKEKRIRYARDILQKEFLPHISQREGSETRKAFFLGYMINRMCQVALGRCDEDDRDHFGKKRLDLAGPLMAQVFRLKFTQLVRDMRV